MSDKCCNCCSKTGEENQRPTGRSSASRPPVLGESHTTLRVAGMDCADEVEAVERALKPLAGVREVRVNLMGGKVVVAHDRSVTIEKFIQAIAGAGLKATPDKAEGIEADSAAEAQRSRFVSVALSGVLAGLGLALQWTKLGPAVLSLGAFVAAIISGGWFIVPKALRAARKLSPDMNLLMTVAVIGAAIIGQWSEAAAVTFLFALAELLESFSVARARRAIQSLLKLAPETALLKRGEHFEEVPVEQVQVGELIAIKSGSRVPLDGEVVSGSSAVNQAPITGESMPVEKKTGDTVFAGSINGQGAFEVRVTKPPSDTMLARIIHLVGEAQAQKAPSQRFVDVFARYYTPAVMAVALLVWLLPPLAFGGAWLAWTYRALVLLVIACPCALVISTPVSIVSGLTALARHGVLIKGGAVLEAVGKLTALATDKTGTITEGQPRVIRTIPLNAMPETELLRIAAAIDSHSEHPLAQAVVAYTREKGIQFPRSENYQAQSGRGAEAELNGHHYFVGNHRFTHELAVCSEQVEHLQGTNVPPLHTNQTTGSLAERKPRN